MDTGETHQDGADDHKGGKLIRAGGVYLIQEESPDLIMKAKGQRNLFRIWQE